MSWTSVKLADLATVSSGGGAPQDADAFSTEGTPFVRAGSLIKLLEGLPEDSLELLQPEVAAAHKLKLFPAGTVVFAKSGMSATKGHIYQLKKPAYVVNHLAALTPRSEIAGKYLRHVLQFKSPTCLIKDEAYPSIRLGEIENMEVPAPKDDAEKERIAAILDQADELRRKRQRAIERLNQLGRAIFHEMFGDPTTNPKGWPTVPASTLATRITVGLVVKPASYYQDTGVPAIRGTNIKLSGIDTSDMVYFSKRDNETKLAKSRIWTDDIVIVRSGRPGLAAIVPPELNGTNAIDVLIFSPDKNVTTSRFIRDLLNSEGGKRLVLSESRGQVQQHFNVGSLSKADFFLPPIALQREYEEQIADLQKSIGSYELAFETSTKLFEALQHRAFQGEL